MKSDLDRVATLSRRLADAEELDTLLDIALTSLVELWGFQHSMLLVVEEGSDSLVTLASHGYERAGVGSEVVLGAGTIGVAAARRTAVRLGNVRDALRYARAARSEIARDGEADKLSKEIPLPGLADVTSQLAVPMLAEGRLIGVICIESAAQGAFDDTAEKALSIAAHQIAAGIALASPDREARAATDAPATAEAVSGEPIGVRYYHEDSSIFLDGDYLIKSLPGRILWRLLLQWRNEGRREFTTKELRLDTTLRLPPVKDNLDTRLILLRRRLEERCDAIRMVKSGRGRFRLELSRPFTLEEL